MPREPPLPRAFVSRSLLGVVVPGPGVPGRRERGWGSLAPIPREGPRGLTLRVAGAARLTRRGAARGARAAAVPSRLWSAAEDHGAVSGAGECGRELAGSAGPRGRPGSGAFPPAAAPPRPPLCFVSAGPRRCDSHFRSWRLEGVGWGGAGETVRGAEGRGAGSGQVRGRAAGR